MLEKIKYLFLRPPSVLRVGHPILRLPTKEVTKQHLQSSEFQSLIKKMTIVFSSPYYQVVGLAANQIGFSESVIAYKIKGVKGVKDHPLTFLVNPKLKNTSTSTEFDYESCESVPHYNGLVKRYTNVQVKSWDLEGNDIVTNANGFLARILQHEIDHLQGHTFLDKMEKNGFRHNKYIDEFELKH